MHESSDDLVMTTCGLFRELGSTFGFCSFTTKMTYLHRLGDKFRVGGS